MFHITASWWVCDEYSCGNEWETLEPTTFAVGLTTALDMVANPHRHEVAFNEDAPDETSMRLNTHKGIFLVRDDSLAFSGRDTEGEWLPLFPR